MWETFHKILSIPHNIVMYLNNAMLSLMFKLKLVIASKLRRGTHCILQMMYGIINKGLIHLN